MVSILDECHLCMLKIYVYVIRKNIQRNILLMHLHGLTFSI